MQNVEFVDNKTSDINEDVDVSVQIRRLLGIVLDHWVWFLISLLIFSFGGYFYIKHATFKYKVHATLLVEDQEKGSDFLGGSGSGASSSMLGSFSDLMGIKSSVDNEAQILQTRDIMRRVVEEMNLNINYFKRESFRTTPLYKEVPFSLIAIDTSLHVSPTGSFLSKITYDKNKNLFLFKLKGKDLDSSFYVVPGALIHTRYWNFKFLTTINFWSDGDTYLVTVNPVKNTVASMEENLNVAIPNKQVSTINLDLTTAIPEKGVDILNKFIEIYLRSNVEQKTAYADSTISFIDGRINIVNQELGGAEKRLQQFKQANNIADLQAQSQAVIQSTGDYVKSLNQVEVQLQVVETMLHYLENVHNNQKPVPSISGTDDPSFMALIQAYNTLQLQAERLRVGSTEENPALINLNSQIQSLRKSLLNNLHNQRTALFISKSNLSSQTGKLSSYLKGVPPKERIFLDLSRQQDVKQALYVYLLQKKEEVAITKSSNISSSRLIDSPESDSVPFSPKSSAIYAGSVLLGLLFPFGLFFLAGIFNNKIESAEDVKKLTSIPVLGEIAHSDHESPLVYRDDPRSVLSEQFRLLRTNLQFVFRTAIKNDTDRKCPVIVLSSGRSGEGKSMLSLNIAESFASTGKKVLLMGLDLRKPTISSYLKLPSGKGFSDYIASDEDEVPLSSVINQLFIKKRQSISVITSGTIPPNPAELLMDKKVEDMFVRLKEMFDLIIVDTPPIGLVADALVLSAYANVELFVVRQNFTLKHEIGLPNGLVHDKKVNNLYLVLNDVKVKKSSRYGYSYSYGYSYGYGYGYGNYNKKKKRESLSHNLLKWSHRIFESFNNRNENKKK